MNAAGQLTSKMASLHDHRLLTHNFWEWKVTKKYRHQTSIRSYLNPISITSTRVNFEVKSEIRGCLRAVFLTVAKDVNQLNCCVSFDVWGGGMCHLRFWCLLWSEAKRAGCFGRTLRVSAAEGSKESPWLQRGDPCDYDGRVWRKVSGRCVNCKVTNRLWDWNAGCSTLNWRIWRRTFYTQLQI